MLDQEEKVVLVDNEFATSVCYPESGIVFHTFYKFCTGEDFRHVLTSGADAFEKYHCTKWLSDDRKFPVIHPDDREWGDANWVPRVMSAGWKYFAMILPENMVGQLALKNMIAFFAEQGVIVEVFDNPEEGMKWLETCESDDVN